MMSMFNLPKGMADMGDNPFMKMMDPSEMTKVFEVPAVTTDHHKMIAQAVATPAVMATAAMAAPAMWFGFWTGMSRTGISDTGLAPVAPAPKTKAQTQTQTKAQTKTKAKRAKAATPKAKSETKDKPADKIAKKLTSKNQTSADKSSGARAEKDINPRLADLARSDISVASTKAKLKTDAAPVAKQKPITRKSSPVASTAKPVKKPTAEAAASSPGLKAKDRPAGLEAPKGGKADDLKLISGVGPKLESVLNDLGIYHFDQIAAWTFKQVEWVDGYLKFSGRITRDDWIAQAKALAKGGREEYVKVFGKEPR